MAGKRWPRRLLVLVVLFLVAQLIPFGASDNPPVEEEVQVPTDVAGILERSCYDCHSHETVWPWYSRVAPSKWLVGRDVAEGREHLNFSTWNAYDAEEAAHKWEEVAELVEEGDMPMKIYLPLHPEARLTAADRERLVAYALSQAGEGEHDEEGR